MQEKIIRRSLWPDIDMYLNEFPAWAILGPFQPGKSILTHHFISGKHLYRISSEGIEGKILY